MRKMIIFAQGAGVEISGVSKGKITDNISVKYTEASDAVNYNGGKVSFSSNEDKIVTDNSLQGVVATVEPTGDCIDPGQFDITFGDAKPQSYTIYYEPAVKACYSLEKDGVEYLSSDAQTSEGSLNPGTYKLTAYIGDAYQKSDKGKPIDVSAAEEIQDISFDVVLTGSGVVGGRQEFSYDQLKNGADVKLQRGDIECNAEATILSGKYSVDVSALSDAFSAIKVKDTYRIEISYEKPTAKWLSYRFRKTNFNLHSLNKNSDKEKMIKAVATCYDTSGNQVDITDEQWAQVTAQTLKLYSENTCVQYDNSAFDFHTENGKGVFYLCPRYWQENDKPSKKKTTHTNYMHGKRLCNVRTELYIDVSDSLAYSTLGTPLAQKSAVYEISLCMWHTIIFLIVFFWIFFCIFKKRLPKVKAGKLHQTDCLRRTLNRRGKWDWEAAKPHFYDSDTTVYIKKKMSTVLIPFVPQKGKIELGKGMPTLKIEAMEIFGPRSRVKLINSPSDFGTLGNNYSVATDNSYLTIKGVFINKENLESKKGKFEFSTGQSLISFGYYDYTMFKKYNLHFKKQKHKKKGKKK